MLSENRIKKKKKVLPGTNYLAFHFTAIPPGYSPAMKWASFQLKKCCNNMSGPQEDGMQRTSYILAAGFILYVTWNFGN